MKAKLFSIHWRDLFKGLILATITAALTFVIGELQSGNPITLKKIEVAALVAFLSYIIKNFLTNSKDEFVTPEPK